MPIAKSTTKQIQLATKEDTTSATNVRRQWLASKLASGRSLDRSFATMIETASTQRNTVQKKKKNKNKITAGQRREWNYKHKLYAYINSIRKSSSQEEGRMEEEGGGGGRGKTETHKKQNTITRTAVRWHLLTILRNKKSMNNTNIVGCDCKVK